MPSKRSPRAKMRNKKTAVRVKRSGASKGGIARAENLSARRRAQIARKAANVRWAKAGKAKAA